jgi:DNA-binding PadR family transcriptional regulator
MGPHPRFRGFGHFGSDFRSGRKLTSDDLQLLILHQLAESPSHGYEIIKALEERSGGFYRPSPGMIYPALSYLEEIGYATVEADGAKKLYHITGTGKTKLAENRETIEALLKQFANIGGKMGNLRRAFAGEPDDTESGSSEMHAARRALRFALSEKKDSPKEEAKRIAEILKRAAAEILGK